MATSTDGGVSWGNVKSLIQDTGNQYFNDKESITADPMKAGVAYAVWDRLASPGAGAKARGYLNATSYRGPTYFSRTTDGGKTWEPARPIYDPGQNNQTIANQIVVLPDGTLVDIFTEISGYKNAKGIRGSNIAVQRSTDGGLNWSAPIRVAKLNVEDVTIPNTGELVRTGDIIPDIAVDSKSGALYAVWQNLNLSGSAIDGVLLSKSTDGGLSWLKKALL